MLILWLYFILCLWFTCLLYGYGYFLVLYAKSFFMVIVLSLLLYGYGKHIHTQNDTQPHIYTYTPILIRIHTYTHARAHTQVLLTSFGYIYRPRISILKDARSTASTIHELSTRLVKPRVIRRSASCNFSYTHSLFYLHHLSVFA